VSAAVWGRINWGGGGGGRIWGGGLGGFDAHILNGLLLLEVLSFQVLQHVQPPTSDPDGSVVGGWFWVLNGKQLAEVLE
jgi:hypothetical protein